MGILLINSHRARTVGDYATSAPAWGRGPAFFC